MGGERATSKIMIWFESPCCLAHGSAMDFSRLAIACLVAAPFLLGHANAESQTDAPEYEWVQVTARAPFAPRDGAGALVFQNKMWLMGGWNPGDKKNFPRAWSNDIWNSEDGAEWTLIKTNSFLDATFDPGKDWEGRHTAGYAVFQNKMWMVAGNNMESDVWKLVRKKL